jgi:hypothetical protein
MVFEMQELSRFLKSSDLEVPNKSGAQSLQNINACVLLYGHYY